MRFIVGADHGGATLLNQLVQHLERAGHQVLSRFGAKDSDDRVDYPDVARLVAQEVLKEPDCLGLLVCGTGQGMAISANKVPGIRAGVAGDVFSARMLRAHNDAQILCLGERVLGVELAKMLLDEFTQATFEGGRHAERVKKMMSIHD